MFFFSSWTMYLREYLPPSHLTDTVRLETVLNSKVIHTHLNYSWLFSTPGNTAWVKNSCVCVKLDKKICLVIFSLKVKKSYIIDFFSSFLFKFLDMFVRHVIGDQEYYTTLFLSKLTVQFLCYLPKHTDTGISFICSSVSLPLTLWLASGNGTCFPRNTAWCLQGQTFIDEMHI